MCMRTVGLALLALAAAVSTSARETLDRGAIAVRSADGVYLSWRLLKSDADAAFDVYRKLPGDKVFEKANFAPITDTTDYFDKAAAAGAQYRIAAVGEAPDDSPIVEPGNEPYISIPMQGSYKIRSATAADLDGDGQLEILIKQPNFNVDPYQKEGYWKKSEDTYKLEAYKMDGTMLWRHDMGWSIEEGTWYSPVMAYDIDGDGKAEVYCKAGEGDPRDEKGLVQTGPEWLLKLDGATGKIMAKTDWPSREGFEDYNRYCRNFLSLAYLNGNAPSILIDRGTYTLIKIWALDKDLKPIWKWASEGEWESYRGQGGHKIQAADVDGDGRDEVVFGSACLDDDGTPMWTTGLGHPDCLYVNDHDPSRPGLEIYYGQEKRQEKYGVCMADAKTGEIVWGYDGATTHVHGKGMAGDIVAAHPGIEFYATEKDGSQSWLYSASGERIGSESIGGISPIALWWDADPYKEILVSTRIFDYQGETHFRFEGSCAAVADVLGDWREEVIASLDGEVRIYFTTIPAESRRVCLLEDRLYRTGLANSMSGYYFEPQWGGKD